LAQHTSILHHCKDNNISFKQKIIAKELQKKGKFITNYFNMLVVVVVVSQILVQ